MSTVLITGANRGLGLEFARQYAVDGWQVIATARQPEKSEELRKLSAAHCSLSPQELDIASDESVQGLADALDGKPVDVLILNSGFYILGKDRTSAKSTMRAGERHLRRMSWGRSGWPRHCWRT